MYYTGLIKAQEDSILMFMKGLVWSILAKRQKDITRIIVMNHINSCTSAAWNLSLLPSYPTIGPITFGTIFLPTLIQQIVFLEVLYLKHWLLKTYSGKALLFFMWSYWVASSTFLKLVWSAATLMSMHTSRRNIAVIRKYINISLIVCVMINLKSKIGKM